MASFCSTCGFPLGASGAFCPRCGARLQTGSVPQPPAPSPASSNAAAPAAAAAKGGSGMKILVIVLVTLMVTGAAAIGGVWYAGYWVKKKVEEKAAAYGVDLHSPQSSPSPSAAAADRAPAPAPCSLLSTAEASRLLDEPVQDAIMIDAKTCSYYGPPGLTAKLRQEQGEKLGQLAQGGNGAPQQGQVPEQLMRLLQAGAAEAPTHNGESPVFTLAVSSGESEPSAMKALELSARLFKGATGGSEEVPNLGDHAQWLADLALGVLKGHTTLTLIPGPVPGAHEKTVAVARTIVTRL
jgi:hypothetical protein